MGLEKLLEKVCISADKAAWCVICHKVMKTFQVSCENNFTTHVTWVLAKRTQATKLPLQTKKTSACNIDEIQQVWKKWFGK